MSDERPAVAWLDGKPWAMLHSLPDDTRWSPDIESGSAAEDDPIRHSMVMGDPARRFLNNQPVLVVAWPDGTTPRPPSSTEGADPFAAVKGSKLWRDLLAAKDRLDASHKVRTLEQQVADLDDPDVRAEQQTALGIFRVRLAALVTAVEGSEGA